MTEIVRKTIIERYEEHLLTTCGLAPGSINRYKWHVLKFLRARFGDPAKADLNALGGKDFIAHISALSGHYALRTRKDAVSSLRSFLRWLELNGQCGSDLINAVPTVSCPKSPGIPMHLSETQLSSFLNSFDRESPIGLRDHTAAICMVRLGLRVGEVVRLSLDDLDWRQGVLRINKGKGRRGNILPILREVGEAILSYLRHGRPPTNSRFIFVSHKNPRKPVHRDTIRDRIRKAIKSLGTDLPYKGTHVLRHTAATRMLQKGATLKEIADILGHRSIDTTAIYAKVDLPNLSDVAMPWPEVEL